MGKNQWRRGFRSGEIGIERGLLEFAPVSLVPVRKSSERLRVNSLYVPCRDRADLPFREQHPQRRFTKPVPVADGCRLPATDEIQLNDSFLLVSSFCESRDLRGKTNQVAPDRGSKVSDSYECEVHIRHQSEGRGLFAAGDNDQDWSLAPGNRR